MGEALESDVNLRAPSHTLRYVVIGVGALAAGAAFFLFNSSSDKADQTKLLRFDAFRAAYADKCGVPSYTAPVAEAVSHAYLSSSIVQTAVEKELAALNTGAACNEVVLALKKVDFAIPQPAIP
jgi:hypothetical protein